MSTAGKPLHSWKYCSILILPGAGIAEGEGYAEGEAEGEGYAEGEAEGEGYAEGEAEGEGYAEGEAESSHAHSKKHKKTSYTPKGRAHPMDCSDIVIGMARGSVGKVYDAYTRDRSTPREDEFYGGQDDLTAAIAYEEDGITTVAFRRQLACKKKKYENFNKTELKVKL